MSTGIPPHFHPVPRPLDDEEAGREARIRTRFEQGRRLARHERDFLARLPANHEIPAWEVQAIAERAGGVEPLDAATGKPHVAKPPGESGDRA